MTESYDAGPWRFETDDGRTATVLYRGELLYRNLEIRNGLEATADRYLRWADEDHFVDDIPGPHP